MVTMVRRACRHEVRRSGIGCSPVRACFFHREKPPRGRTPSGDRDRREIVSPVVAGNASDGLTLGSGAPRMRILPRFCRSAEPPMPNCGKTSPTRAFTSPKGKRGLEPLTRGVRYLCRNGPKGASHKDTCPLLSACQRVDVDGKRRHSSSQHPRTGHFRGPQQRIPA